MCWCRHELNVHRDGSCVACLGSRLLQPVHAFRPIATLPYPPRMPGRALGSLASQSLSLDGIATLSVRSSS